MALGFVIYSITGIGVLTSIRLQAIIILSYEGECDLHEESHVSHLIICLVCPAYLFSQGHEKTLRQAATWNKQRGFLKIAPRISGVPFHSGWEAEPCMSLLHLSQPCLKSQDGSKGIPIEIKDGLAHGWL